jgi:hypothetical protein
VTGLLVAGDLFADCGLAHLSLCIEGTGAHIALASIGRPGGDGSGKAAQENIFASIPESAGNGRLTGVCGSPWQPSRTVGRSEVPQDRAAFGDERTKGGWHDRRRDYDDKQDRRDYDDKQRSGGWGNPCYPTDAWIRTRRGSLEWCGAS